MKENAEIASATKIKIAFIMHNGIMHAVKMHNEFAHINSEYNSSNELDILCAFVTFYAKRIIATHKSLVNADAPSEFIPFCVCQ